MTEWQDISTAPKDGTEVLLFGLLDDSPRGMTEYHGAYCICGYWEALDEAWCAIPGDWDGPFFYPTHWMSLPSPPKEGA